MKLPTKKKPLEPKNQRIETLINAMDSRELVIPPFQREFIWKRHNVLYLFDSILQSYPIGSFLVWNTDQGIQYRDKILDLRFPQINNAEDLKIRDFILDGQQRLSCLYGVLKLRNAEKEHIFNVYIDLEEMTFFHYRKNMEVKKNVHFPMSYLYDDEKFLDFRGELGKDPANKELQETLIYLYSHFRNYIIPVIVTYEKTVGEVTPVFVRFNSAGRKLDIFDLTAAVTWKDNFDIRDEITRINGSLQKKRFQHTDKHLYLKMMAALHAGATKTNVVDKLNDLSSNELKSLLRKAEIGLQRAIDFLQAELFVYGEDFLPYENQLVALTYFFSLANNPGSKQLKSLQRWFWISGFSERFRGASESILDEDIRYIEKLVRGEDGISLPDEGYRLEVKDLLNKKYNRSSAFTKSFILFLASQTPKDLASGTKINLQRPLSEINRMECHHIFPRRILRNSAFSNEKIDNICNICLCQSNENKRIKDRNPSEYLQKCYDELGADAENVFHSSLIPNDMNAGWKEDDYEIFLGQRARLIVEGVNKKILGDK